MAYAVAGDPGSGPVSRELLYMMPDEEERAGFVLTFPGWKFAVKHRVLLQHAWARAVDGASDLGLFSGLSLRDTGRMVAALLDRLDDSFHALTEASGIWGSPGLCAQVRGRQEIDRMDDSTSIHLQRDFRRWGESDEQTLARLYLALAYNSLELPRASVWMADNGPTAWRTLWREMFPDVGAISSVDCTFTTGVLWSHKWGRQEAEALALWFDLLTLSAFARLVGDARWVHKANAIMEAVKAQVMCVLLPERGPGLEDGWSSEVV